MKIRRALFKIFGPVILAALLVVAVLIIPFASSGFNHQTIERAAVSQSKNVFKGVAVKRQALAENYVPFMGSSELSRMDSFHPSVLAQHYHRDYRPFLLGAAGSQSLTHYWGMQGINHELQNKKAVMIVSPQWFVKQGQNPIAFMQYHSNLQTVTWLLQATTNKDDRYAAQRLLDMQVDKADSRLDLMVKKIADGKQLSQADRTYLQLEKNSLANQDRWFSTLSMKNRTDRINKAAGQLPSSPYNVKRLDAIAYEMGDKATTNNQFRVNNKFWNKRLKGNYRKLKGEQKNFNYVQSPEFADFQLVLNQFHKDNMDVMFVIPPVNKRWSQYTGLSMAMLRQFDRKINYQLRSQGFTNIVDLSNDGGEDFFMQDTIHLGWRGWLKVDQHVAPFLEGKYQRPHYQMNDYFYSKQWQDMANSQLNQYLAKN
ncbi:D-alanyl-lipoteichoic acid biosynthesis protein DltD [Ligilactobacillus saerimneri]|uniref:Protein DltD n=1 Tax=Ligilactobacillus saerimneri 30a TaxID=1227363 RepID=M5J7F8_9LACO|nr:D-alanyl-lipoteichoic acid biosynthesis protein DltD [Ligilactobacillus saerimneri]EKW98694.1 Protein dltD [Ligilactobacillus saerimneri 30a]